MKAYCRRCKYYSESSFDHMVTGRCQHPAARQFSRVNGYYAPLVYGAPFVEPPQTLKDCDENGWFEPIPERKKFWGLI